MTPSHRSGITALCAVAIVLIPWFDQRCAAQTDLDFLIRPWEARPHIAETFDDIVYITQGTDQTSEADISIFDWDSYGRIKFDKQNNDPNWWLGYRLLTIEID